VQEGVRGSHARTAIPGAGGPPLLTGHSSSALGPLTVPCLRSRQLKLPVASSLISRSAAMATVTARAPCAPALCSKFAAGQALRQAAPAIAAPRRDLAVKASSDKPAKVNE